MKISRVLKMVCLLALLFAIGSLGTAPPVAAQQRTCYRLVKTITCADDIYKDDPGCVTVRPYDLFTQPDGSIIGKYKERALIVVSATSSNGTRINADEGARISVNPHESVSKS
jgi:hypothetical protein